MAKYKGREVTVIAYPVEEYKVSIATIDGNKTVPLREVTLSQKEAVEFLKTEQKKTEEAKKASEEKTVPAVVRTIEVDKPVVVKKVK